jgi:Mg2+ and Co2+ transporter CorA
MMARRVDPDLRESAKSALRQCLRIMSSVQVRSIWLDAPHVTSKALLYALTDDSRDNVPSAVQLIEVGDAMLAASVRLSEGAAELYRIAEMLIAAESKARAA